MRRLQHLERVLNAANRDPRDPPAGLSARRIDRDRDAGAIEALDAACFAAAFGYERQPLDRWRREHLDPSLPASMVITDADAIVAFSILLPGDPPWIEILGVAPAWRRRGVATWLLRRAFADLVADGATSVRLAVDADNEHGAPRLYAAVGMRVRRTFAIHERSLDGSASPV